ncbi:hypothetical protein SALBM311S_00811 [Streptomyces alboniger]
MSTPSTCLTYVMRSPGSGVGLKTVTIAVGEPVTRFGRWLETSHSSNRARCSADSASTTWRTRPA